MFLQQNFYALHVVFLRWYLQCTCYNSYKHPRCQPLCQGIQTSPDSSIYTDCLSYVGNILTCLEEGQYPTIHTVHSLVLLVHIRHISSIMTCLTLCNNYLYIFSHTYETFSMYTYTTSIFVGERRNIFGTYGTQNRHVSLGTLT